jgi:hypothetical protein
MTLLFFLAAMVGSEPNNPRPPEGVVTPYRLTKIYRAFGRCRDGRREHAAIDIGGQGENGGLGTPIVSMTNSVVIKVGRSDKLLVLKASKKH